jgi:hypothetical protein
MSLAGNGTGWFVPLFLQLQLEACNVTLLTVARCPSRPHRVCRVHVEYLPEPPGNHRVSFEYDTLANT